MKKLLLLAFVAFTAALSFGQCSASPTGGTECFAPLKTKVGQGQSTTFTFDMTPASLNAPCNKLVAGTPYYRLCGQSNQITVDFGDGKGFVPLQGPKGDQGIPGVDGQSITGPPGPAGIDGKDGQSIKGDTGAPGIAATVTVGGVSSGTTPVVWNSGNANAAVLNFVLQKGDSGKDGAPGVIVGSVLTVTLSCPRGKGTIVGGFISANCTANVTGIK